MRNRNLEKMEGGIRLPFSAVGQGAQATVRNNRHAVATFGLCTSWQSLMASAKLHYCHLPQFPAPPSVRAVRVADGGIAHLSVIRALVSPDPCAYTHESILSPSLHHHSGSARVGRIITSELGLP